MPDGTLIGLAVLGEGENVMTFPAYYRIGTALGSPHWIRQRLPGDKEPFIAERYKLLENPEGARTQPRTLIHEGGRIAETDDLMGMDGTMMTALVSIRREPRCAWPCGTPDLTGIKTPPTPEGEEGSEGPADVDEVEVATPPFSAEGEGR